MEHNKKIRRSSLDHLFVGVAGGLGEYFETDPLVFRALFVLLTLMSGVGIILYILLAILMPKEGEERGGLPEDIADRAKEMAAELKARHAAHRHHHRTTFGLIIILIGALLLVNQIFPHRIQWNLVGPSVLIILGVLLLLRPTK
jgi:phage shock protein PspC (stress-responsive transcriptional regulator)